MGKPVRSIVLIVLLCGAFLGVSQARADEAEAPDEGVVSYQDFDQAVQVAQADPERLPSPEGFDAEDLRLDLAKVNLYAETRRYGPAFELLERLKRKYPDNARVLAAEADLNWRIGNVQGASRHLNKALLIDPGDEDILERQRALARARRANVSGEILYRRTEIANELIGKFSGEAPVTETVNVLLDFENDRLRFDDAPPTGDRTVNEQRGSLGATMLFDNDDEAGLSLYANTDTLGVGLQYNLWDKSGGETLFKGDFQRPDWSYVEMVVDRGTKSAVYVQHKRPFGADFNATVGAGYNWYALDNVSDAAQSSAWTLSIEYAPLIELVDPDPDKDLHLSLAYGVDGEYLTSIKHRGPFGQKVIPISDYEIHALMASARQAVWDDLTFEVYGGYGVNRLDRANGPLFGGVIDYALFEDVVFGVRAAHTRFGGNNNRQSEDQVALNVKWVL